MKNVFVGMVLVALAMSVNASGVGNAGALKQSPSVQAPPTCLPGYVAVPILVNGRIVGWECEKE
jgi:hypothetical protein